MPADTATYIWRYQDLTKLLWTLANGALWFARADKLDDPYEGSTTQPFKTSLAAAFNDFQIPRENANQALETITRSNQAFRRNAAVSCWHISEHESAAMWQVYAEAGQAVAIRSTIDRFLESLPEGFEFGSGRDESGRPNVHRVEFGAVQYIDHHKEHPPSWRTMSITDPFFFKRKSFSHER